MKMKMRILKEAEVALKTAHCNRKMADEENKSGPPEKRRKIADEKVVEDDGSSLR